LKLNFKVSYKFNSNPTQSNSRSRNSWTILFRRSLVRLC